MKKRIKITIGAILMGMFMVGTILSASLILSEKQQVEMQAEKMEIDMDKTISVLP